MRHAAAVIPFVELDVAFVHVIVVITNVARVVDPDLCLVEPRFYITGIALELQHLLVVSQRRTVVHVVCDT